MNIIHIVSIICFALCLFILFYLKWYVKKRTSFTGLEERQTEIAHLIAEIDRITDRDSQLVEDRVNKLKIILHDVDKRIALYEKELEYLSLKKDPANETLYTSLGRGIRAALKTPDEIIPVNSQTNNNTADSAVFPAANPVTQLPSFSEPEHTLVPNEHVPKNPSKKQIRSLIDLLVSEGLPAEEIASRLGISTAEVNLAMNLLRAKKNKS